MECVADGGMIVGFPRKMDQGEAFEASVVHSLFTLFLDCPEQVMQARLLDRGKTSGRADDNVESIKKRFKTFVDTSMPVVDAYEKQGKVEKVVADAAPEVVYAEIRTRMGRRGVKPLEKEAVEGDGRFHCYQAGAVA